jgi:hypothetical protein
MPVIPSERRLHKENETMKKMLILIGALIVGGVIFTACSGSGRADNGSRPAAEESARGAPDNTGAWRPVNDG